MRHLVINFFFSIKYFPLKKEYKSQALNLKKSTNEWDERAENLIILDYNLNF